jgi:multicomponent Na+:H+ antiporter subunit F
MASILIQIAIVITLLSMLISLIRFLKGPHKVDRIISFDVTTISSIALIGFLATITEKIIYLDVALVYGILGFLGVIIVARYLERGF